MAANSPSTPAEYLASLPEPRKSQLAELDRFIRQTVPSLQRVWIAGMLGYGPYHYVTRSGCEGDWPVVGLSSRKQYISLYVCACDADGTYLAEQCRPLLPKASIGKSCIRFKRIEDLEMQVVADLLMRAEKWYHAQTQSPKPKPAAKKRTATSSAAAPAPSRAKKGTKR